MDTTEFERLLQLYFKEINTTPVDYEAADLCAYEALTEAAGLLSVSMLVQR